MFNDWKEDKKPVVVLFTSDGVLVKKEDYHTQEDIDNAISESVGVTVNVKNPSQWGNEAYSFLSKACEDLTIKERNQVKDTLQKWLEENGQ